MKPGSLLLTGFSKVFPLTSAESIPGVDFIN
jgi:hypothetical protein